MIQGYNALNGSRELLAASAKEDAPQAVVGRGFRTLLRPYLNIIFKYGDEQVRQQIQAALRCRL